MTNAEKAGAAAAAGLCGAYTIIKHKNDLHFYHYEIKSPKLPEEFDGYKILHLSDLHSKDYGKEGEILTEACSDFEPDMITFTGDLYSRNGNIFTIKRSLPLMKRLRKIAPVYYVWGNHEADMPRNARYMDGLLEHAGINVINNKRERVYCGCSSIDIHGLSLESRFYKNAAGGYKDLPNVSTKHIRSLLGEPDRKSFNILLAHTPMPFVQYAEWGADFVMAGHCHGGMIRLPGGIGLLSPERKLFPRFTKGLYRCRTEYGDSVMEVSAGLGKFRINNPEMVSICILRRSK